MHRASTTNSFTTARRDSTGIGITIALHAGVAALALIGFNVVNAPSHPLKPIMIVDVPVPPATPQTLPDPRIIDQPMHIDNIEPVFAIDQPVPHDPVHTTPYEPPIAGPVAADPGPIAIKPPPATGPSQIARFDPRYASTAQPPYPIQATRLEQEGVVIVHVRIGRDGRVLDASLAQSSGSAWLDKAALAHALAKWRFTPALKDGEAIESSRDISVRFELKRG